MIRAIVADGHRPFREGLRRLLEETGRIVVVGEAGDGEAVGSVIRRTPHDLLILNVSLPGGNGCALLEEARRAGVTSRVLVIADQAGALYRAHSIRAGATDFLPKGDIPERIVEVIGGMFATA